MTPEDPVILVIAVDTVGSPVRFPFTGQGTHPAVQVSAATRGLLLHFSSENCPQEVGADLTGILPFHQGVFHI